MLPDRHDFCPHANMLVVIIVICLSLKLIPPPENVCDGLSAGQFTGKSHLFAVA